MDEMKQLSNQFFLFLGIGENHIDRQSIRLLRILSITWHGTIKTRDVIQRYSSGNATQTTNLGWTMDGHDKWESAIANTGKLASTGFAPEHRGPLVRAQGQFCPSGTCWSRPRCLYSWRQPRLRGNATARTSSQAIWHICKLDILIISFFLFQLCVLSLSAFLSLFLPSLNLLNRKTNWALSAFGLSFFASTMI